MTDQPTELFFVAVPDKATGLPRMGKRLVCFLDLTSAVVEKANIEKLRTDPPLPKVERRIFAAQFASIRDVMAPERIRE